MQSATPSPDAGAALAAALDAFVPLTDSECADVERLRRLAASGDPWARSSPLHATGSAFILDVNSGRVLLRWHERMQAWLQVGGHADPAEADPYQIALREAEEETGLRDLAPWPDPRYPSVIQIAVVPVPAGRCEPAHEHADVRYVLATARPGDARPESTAARLRWLALSDALALASEDNVRVCLRRIAQHLTRT